MLHNIQYTIITECGFGNKLKSYVNPSLFDHLLIRLYFTICVDILSVDMFSILI